MQEQSDRRFEEQEDEDEDTRKLKRKRRRKKTRVKEKRKGDHRQIRVQRGVPEGAPESPLVFVKTSDCALGRLQEQCSRKDVGWSLTRLLLIHCLAYASDVLVFARSESSRAPILCQCCVEHRSRSCSGQENVLVQ